MTVTYLWETGGDIFDSWTLSSDRPSLALPLSVNLNCYATKVAIHIKLPLSRSVLPESRPFEVTIL